MQRPASEGTMMLPTKKEEARHNDNRLQKTASLVLSSLGSNHCGRKVRTCLEVRRFRFEPPNECNTKYIKIYTNIYKYIQDKQNIYKIPSGGQAAAARPGPKARVPVRPGRLGAGPGRCRLAAAWYFV